VSLGAIGTDVEPVIPNVKFLSKKVIEAEADALLVAYGRDCSPITKPPIPVEDILETHLGLSLDLDDLRKLVGAEDVLGATWMSTREVFIDQSLDPDEHAKMRGRYLFTVAHEIGHWQLHRQYLLPDEAQAGLLVKVPTEALLVGLTEKEKRRIERQANFFASCLLMPRAMVCEAWREGLRFMRTFNFKTDRALKRQILGREVLRHIVNTFQVSSVALCIRMAELGFLERYGLRKPGSSEAA